MTRKMCRDDKQDLLAMMRVFYASDALLTNGSEEIFESDIEHCLDGDPYIEGYVFENCGVLQGYAMLAKSYSTEFGKRCVWLEDLYLKEEYRGKGIAREFLNEISKQYADCLLRLEVESENERAVKVYQNSGFRILPYVEMIKQ